jgi:hypothetical protein
VVECLSSKSEALSSISSTAKNKKKRRLTWISEPVQLILRFRGWLKSTHLSLLHTLYIIILLSMLFPLNFISKFFLVGTSKKLTCNGYDIFVSFLT